jgi:hypothetical protein
MAFDPYENPEQGSVYGAWGPKIMAGLKGMHARDIAKEMMTQGFKRGGRVPRTGLALVHKGETVIPAKGFGHGPLGGHT